MIDRAATGLRIVLGRRRLERELAARLKADDVLELDAPDGLVEVHAGGRLIGHGVPVEVDGHFAVRMTRLERTGQ